MNELKLQVFNLKKDVVELEKNVDEFDQKVYEIIIFILNILLDLVFVGKDENDNQVINIYDNLGRKLVLNVLLYYEIGNKLDIFDFERVVKLLGLRFVIFKGVGVKLVCVL